jgi:hypothetical protein
MTTNMPPQQWIDRVTCAVELVRSGLPIPEAIGIGHDGRLAIVIESTDHTVTDTLAWCDVLEIPEPIWDVPWFAPDFKNAEWPAGTFDDGLFELVASAPLPKCPDASGHQGCDVEDCVRTICPRPCQGRVENVCGHGKSLCLHHAGACEQCALAALS